MIEINPQDRLLHFTAHKRPIGTIISLILVAVAIFGAGIFYWVFVSQKFADVYKQLNIAPLPITVELRPEFYSRLDQLRREPCYREAVIALYDSLLEAGYPRESATSVLAFAQRCGSKQNEAMLERAYISLNEVSDFSAALKIVDQLVASDPADAQYRYSRGATYEKLNNYSKALADYIAALQLSGTSSSPGASNVFYDISRMYAALGRYCDAIVPIETFISYKPAERRTPQTLKIISEYADKGNCDANYARGVARVRFLGATGVRTVVAVINGIAGNFLVDTGADYVSVTPEFSTKAKIKVESSDRIPMKTVGGSASAEIGYANTVAVGSAEAQDVVVAVLRGPADPFGGHLDGLLGMSFLARFDFNFSHDAIELTAIPLRGSAAPAAGGQLEDADAARNRGDYGTARQLLRPLADQGSAPAQYNLGVLYAKGQGVPQDYAEAAKWFRAAADQGYANAQYNLGIMYAEGQGIPQNYAEAAKWFHLAADQGHARAQRNLGVQYLSGQGVPQNYSETVKWFRLAAGKGEANSQYDLGFLYGTGQGVPQNYAEALKWYRLAADQGHASAQYNLGFMFTKGQGVPQDYVRAYMWFTLSAAQNGQDALQNRDIIARRMTPAQIAEAQKLAREWRPTKQPPR